MAGFFQMAVLSPFIEPTQEFRQFGGLLSRHVAQLQFGHQRFLSGSDDFAFSGRHARQLGLRSLGSQLA
jgi:hypothetical protein